MGRMKSITTSELLSNLISSDSSLRTATLRILVATTTPSDQSEITTTHSIWANCLQVESSEMSLRNSRERPEQVARLGRLIAGVPLDADTDVSDAAQHAIRYLLSQLKVNYRPLYAETVKALAALSKGRADAIWDNVWSELERTHHSTIFLVQDLDQVAPEWTSIHVIKDKSERKMDEEDEAEFRCTGMDKSRRILDKEWAGIADETSLDADEVSVS